MNYEKHTELKNETRNINSVAKKAGTTALAAVSLAAGINTANAAPAVPPKVPAIERVVEVPTYPAFESHATPKVKNERKVLNSRARLAAYKLAASIQKGPEKPSTVRSEWTLPSDKKGEYIMQATTTFGKASKSSERSYKVTTNTLLFPNGEPDLHSVSMISVRAGNNATLTLEKNWNNPNWTFSAIYRQPKKLENYVITSAIVPEITDKKLETYESQLTPANLDAATSQMRQIIEDAQAGKPVGYYEPAFEHPQPPERDAASDIK